MEISKLKSTLYSCLLLTWTYFIMNLFYAILLVYESATLLTGERAVGLLTLALLLFRLGKLICALASVAIWHIL